MQIIYLDSYLLFSEGLIFSCFIHFITLNMSCLHLVLLYDNYFFLFTGVIIFDILYLIIIFI